MVLDAISGSERFKHPSLCRACAACFLQALSAVSGLPCAAAISVYSSALTGAPSVFFPAFTEPSLNLREREASQSAHNVEKLRPKQTSGGEDRTEGLNTGHFIIYLKSR